MAEAFVQLKKLVIKGYPVERIFVVKAIDIKKEFYCAVTIDPSHNDVVLIASAAGGVDIEETAQKNPEQIQKYYLEGKREFEPARWVKFITKVFPDGGSQARGTDIFNKMVKVFFEQDCSLVEVNPLVIDAAGKWYAADAKINFDDNALYRHPDIAAWRDPSQEDPREVEAKKYELSYVGLDGNIGCIVNGAGLAMATMDIVKYAGGEPANFLDVGGGANQEKVTAAFKIILQDPKVKAILVNIFGGIMRCDVVAEGILAAVKEIGVKVPLVIRLEGTNVEQGKEILKRSGLKIISASTFEEAAEKVVAAL